MLNCAISYSNITIDRKDSVQFLEIIIGQHLSWQDHIAQLANKLSHDIALLLCAARCLPKSVLLTLCNAFFISHLLYAIEFWSNASSACLQKIRVLQKRAVIIYYSC